MRFANCHPSRPHLSKGLCGACYQQQRRKQQSVHLQGREYNKKYYQLHKDIIKGKVKSWREQNKEYATLAKEAGRFKRKYKVSLEQVAAMAEKQNHRCKICYKPKLLVIDHCHTTGIVRGLLCHQCNTMLGMAYDDQDVLRNAIKYLQESLWPHPF